MTPEDALTRLGTSTLEAVMGVLKAFVPTGLDAGDVRLVEGDTHPLAGLDAPAVVANVSYVDGVTGGNVFAMTVAGARKLARAMMGLPADAELGPDESPDELSELELSAVGEAMNQMMAAGAGGTSAVLGTEVEISPPEVRRFDDADEVPGAYERDAHATAAGLTLLGEPCRLVQLVPNAFVVRMTRALDDVEVVRHPPAEGAEAADPGRLAIAFRDVDVDVRVELGRAELPTGRILGLGAGAVLELDRLADEPVDLYVNDAPFGTGRLVVLDGSEWAVRIQTLNGLPAQGGGA